MSVINATPLLAAAGGDYQISRSVRLRSSATPYFNRTPASAGNRRTWTWSGWCKRGILSSAQALFSAWDGSAGQQGGIQFEAGNILQVYTGGNAGSRGDAYTAAVFRDVSAWYHVVVALDTTLATATDRIKIFINGVQQTVTFTAQPPQNTDCQINANIAHRLGSLSGSNYFDGYLTEINFIDGQALTPSSFGETDAVTGVWKPKKYAGTYGTNGFYLNFSDPSAATAAAIGKDYSGNGNNWTPNNISVTAGATYDSMLDVPTLYADGGNGRGNYAVLNPLSKTGQTVSNGNLTYSSSAGTSSQCAAPTFAVGPSGKWYWEVQITSTPQNQTEECIGVVNDIGTPSSLQRAYNSAGQYFDGSSWTAYGGAWAINDVIGIAIDVDNSQITFYKNGTSQGTKTWAWNTNGNCSLRLGSTTGTTYQANFGQRPFAYTPPTGFKALNTQNLPEPTIKKGYQYFDATTYLGTGGTQTVSNLSFQPDLVWIKNRSAVANHALLDSVRPSGFALYPNLTDAEANNSSLFTGISGNSFSLAGGNATYNAANNYISWYWKESPSAGFDIVTYTGNATNRTIAHSLGVAPKMMIVKSRSLAGQNWLVYHSGLGATQALFLDLTNAATTASTPWNNTAPTSSVFSVGTSSGSNANGTTYVAYLFAEVAGFSKFGSYTGNGSADGPFVYCGFRPRWIMIKASSIGGAGYDWWVWDTSRSPSNAVRALLFPNLSDSESTDNWVDITANGFKLRNTYGASNANGQTYIFAAFAENPTKYSLAR